MRSATCIAAVALLSLSGATSALAQASFKAPVFAPPFNNASTLQPGGRQAFGEALAERMKNSTQTATTPSAGTSCAATPQLRTPGTTGICADYNLGNVSMARFSTNFAPIVVIVEEKKP